MTNIIYMLIIMTGGYSMDGFVIKNGKERGIYE